MNDVLPELQTWIDRGDRIALATVIAVKKSAPRPPGAKMAVNEDGEVIGAVSGGCVEGAVIEIADACCAASRRGACTSGSPTRRPGMSGCRAAGRSTYGCRSSPGRVRRRGPRWRACRRGDAARRRRRRRQSDVRRGGSQLGSLGTPELDADAARGRRGAALARDLRAARPTVRRRGRAGAAADPVRGGADRGRALHARAGRRLAALRGRSPDPLRHPERFPEAEEVIAAWPEEAFASLGGIDPATSIAVLTHDPKLDDAAFTIALRSPARFVGAMGSRRAQESRRERLLAAG